MKNIFKVYGLLFLGTVAACSRNMAPLVSSMHTEGLHHKWKITALKGYDQPLSQAGLDLRNVSHSFAIAGCDTLNFTPRFGDDNRIALDDLVSYPVAAGSPCPNDALNAVLKDNLAAASHFELDGEQLELRSREGDRLLKAVIDPGDEKGSIRRRWRITKMINVASDSFAMQHPFIDFTNLSASGAFVGCNRLGFATKVVPPFSISISHISGTYKYCRDAAGFESILTKALPLAAKYQVIGNRLKLLDKENLLLLEAVADTSPATDLQGSGWNPLRREWMLKKLDGIDGELVIQSRASINLADHKQTGGMAGCNRIMFTAQTGEGSSIRFSAIAATKKFCAEFMKVEARYLTLLPQIRSYELSGHFIKFKDAAGKVLAEGVASDWD
ncbi:META domain-containing protein [Niabella drilacis]|uniref:Heat shock protein HslJ n=1 Tax=Niabella drilacis (strain DSM 25811 / CCM 8410 / CCUG 62505 / LMG 26954 / E90) TaxID=1285928 RepID=A0A1G6V6S3_NIADE|nr:META domain-containing protein [Niabella drilacis]SDD48697.1 Heat shock protein HslJ [Niabella drilacis]